MQYATQICKIEFKPLLNESTELAINILKMSLHTTLNQPKTSKQVVSFVKSNLIYIQAQSLRLHIKTRKVFISQTIKLQREPSIQR